jgi:cation diffusion facilitator CzcD-associated flavoprotein CzcO
MTQLDQNQVQNVAKLWLGRFERSLISEDITAILALFTKDGSWRDLVAFSWHIFSWANPDEIHRALETYLGMASPSSFELDGRAGPWLAPRAGREVVEVFFKFRTRTGRADGVVRLVLEEDGEYRAWTLLTALIEITGHEPRLGARRLRHSAFDEGFGSKGWLAGREESQQYMDSEPSVLIVGAGQAGLSVAARLRVLGIDALVVDREERVGDNWRRRYRGLRLHTETPVNHLPYLPFSENAPGFMSGALFGEWLAAYATLMELNVWTHTEFAGGEYDDRSERWTVKLRRAGRERTLHPKHVVVATGLSDIPNVPSIPGLETFAGTKLHSSQFSTGADYEGKSAIVFGAGTSGIDIAQDLYEHGAKVTVVQRGPMTVVNLDPTALMQFALFSSGIPTEVCDLIANADPYPALLRTHKELTKAVREMDRELIEKLNGVGFRTHYGPDDTGNVIQYFRTGGGYYLNVGGAELIIDGKVSVRQFDEVSHFTPDHIVWSKGVSERVHLVLLATGYNSPTAALTRWFGSDVSKSLGAVWGFDEGGELRNMFKRTSQPGLWFIGGGVLHARSYSLYMALQIQACELGLIPKRLIEPGLSTLHSADVGTVPIHPAYPE